MFRGAYTDGKPIKKRIVVRGGGVAFDQEGTLGYILESCSIS